MEFFAVPGGDAAFLVAAGRSQRGVGLTQCDIGTVSVTMQGFGARLGIGCRVQIGRHIRTRAIA